MARKTVSFAEDISTLPESKFQTWPRRVIKYRRSSRLRDDDAPSSAIEKSIRDLYFRFTSLADVNLSKCLEYIVSGKCTDTLVGYSVLNTILKGSFNSDLEDEAHPSNSYLPIDPEVSQGILQRACDDLDRFSTSEDVLDSRILQQIMRVVEGLWLKKCVSKDSTGSYMADFTKKCALLVANRPGSKLLLSPAVRIANIALENSLLSSDDIKEFIAALSRSHFLFAASFTSDVITILTTIYRVEPEILKGAENIWIPMAVRALVSSSVLTRSVALNLLLSCRAGENSALALSLRDSAEPQRTDSEPLIKIVARKLAQILCTSGSLNNISDETRFVMDAWCLILDSSTHLSGPWEQLDYWLEVERIAIRTTPKATALAWGSIIAAQSSDPTYCRALLVALGIPNASEMVPTKTINEAIASVDPSSTLVWDQFLYPLMKSSAGKKDGFALSIWSQAYPRMDFSGSSLSSYLDLLTAMSKSVSANYHQSFINIWAKVVSCCPQSRQKAMEVVRCHYHFLSMESISSSNLAFQLTDSLIRSWPFNFVTDRPKNASFNLLTLILLPAVLFIPSEKQGEYLDGLMANYRSDSSLNIALLALLDTVFAGSEKQLEKWEVASSTIREYLGQSQDSSSVSVCTEALLAFLSLAKEETTDLWQKWQKLLTVNNLSRDKTLAKIDKLPNPGLQCVLSVPEVHQTDKIRLICSSLLKSPSSSDSMHTLAVIKGLNLPTELVDSVARELVAKKTIAAVRLSVDLLPAQRVFVVAKPLLSVIDELKMPEMVKLWNKSVSQSLDNGPALVTKSFADRLRASVPNINLPASIVISSTSSPTAAKRQSLETPPAPSKRPRRAILTGSVPTALPTPPASSDASEEFSIPNDDQLCSSPPQRSKTGGSMVSSPSWRTSQPERARTLKRVMMGLEIDEAVMDMKRSEQEMIYNLMFRSCVKLRTHLAASSTVASSSDVEAASSQLNAVLQRREELLEAELKMIENEKRRMLEGGSQESLSDEDSELDDDDRMFLESQDVKLEF